MKSLTSKFVFAHLDSDGTQWGHKDYILVQAECLYVQFGWLVLLVSIYRRGGEEAKEGLDPKSLVGYSWACVSQTGVRGVKSEVSSRVDVLCRGPAPTLYNLREGTYYNVGRKEKI